MQYLIDILALLVMGFFFRRGWRKGALLSSLGILRIVLAYVVAYFAGRYLGFWLGGVLNRPRIVMIPVTAGIAYVVTTFCIYIYMWRIGERRRIKEEKGEFKRPWLSGLAGGIVGMSASLLTLIVLFWLGDLAITGISGRGVPDGELPHFAPLARRAVYEGTYLAIARKGGESQAAAIAQAISHPEKGLNELQTVLDDDWVRKVLNTEDGIAEAIVRGDSLEVVAHPAFRRMMEPQSPSRDALENLGIISRHETDEEFAQRLTALGQNQNIKISVQNLKARGLLQPDRILELIRDPEFDIIVSELMK